MKPVLVSRLERVASFSSASRTVKNRQVFRRRCDKIERFSWRSLNIFIPRTCMPKLPPATSHILRGSLRSYPANGHASFVPQIRKLVFEYCDYWPSSAHTRTFLSKHVEQLARDNPHVEIVVKQRPYKQPIARGFYSQSPSASLQVRTQRPSCSERSRQSSSFEWI